MRLFIAEKPSLAKAIFEGLGGNPNTEKKNGYFYSNSDCFTPITFPYTPKREVVFVPTEQFPNEVLK